MLFRLSHDGLTEVRHSLPTTHTLPRHEPVLIARRAHDGKAGARSTQPCLVKDSKVFVVERVIKVVQSRGGK
jgi:hypothetical protein